MKDESMKNLTTLLAALALCTLQLACEGARRALDTAQVRIDEARALAAKAEAAAAEADRKRWEVCDESLDHLRAVEAVAPYACGLVAATPDAPKEAAAACAQRDKLTLAIQNFELACSLGGDK